MKPLVIKPNDKETIESTIETLSSRIAPDLREEAKKAFEAEMQGDLDKVQEICVRLLDTEQGKEEPELLMLYGRCLFMKGNILTARTVFRDTIALIPEEAMPRIYHALCLHAIGYHASAAKEFDNLYPLDIYHPFFYTAYGDCLQHVERYEESRTIFAEEIKYYKSTNTIVLPEILDSAFQHLLYLDIYLNNEHYDNDLDTYYNFLEEIEFNESMQKHVAATLVYLCQLNNRNWYWNKFTSLLDHIRDKGYLTLPECQQTLASVYAGLETFKHEKDSNVAPLWHSFFNACYEKHYMALDRDIMPKSEKENILATYFSCVWYMCNYYEEHKDACAYLKETYPRLYEIAEPVLAEIETSPADAKENALIHLMKYVSAGTERFRLEKDLQNKYDVIMTASKNSTLGEGLTYERDLAKINRNAPCPCGSGKKYKKCCGKN